VLHQIQKAMKKLILTAMAAAALAACKPEAYTGPLDSPVGNWEGVHTDYYFDGEMVGEAEDCQYSAISFYKDGLCCIEGIKGAFAYVYDPTFSRLTVDNIIWSVTTLTGAEMVLEYIETIFPEPIAPVEAQDEGIEGPQPDKNGIILPAEYKGKTIGADSNGYYYETAGQERVYCNFYGAVDEAGTLVIDFWYDNHVDHFIPLVVEASK
jgi:hypothetical protein